MNVKEKNQQSIQYFALNNPYNMLHYSLFNYKSLENIGVITSMKGDKSDRVANVIIVGDTETSKSKKNKKKGDTETSKSKKDEDKYIPVYNYVVAWTISLRLPGGKNGYNIVTLYGHKPSEMVEAFKLIADNLIGNKCFIFFHNLAYDWVFLRKFIIKEFGKPEKQLNTKSHYPVTIDFDNGIVLRDSLIMAQRKLEKWAKDLDVKHKKALGKWDYDKIRNQDEEFTDDELEYIEHDTVATCECIDYTMETLGEDIATLPLTATGIPRKDFIKIARANYHKKKFIESALTLEQYLNLAEYVYHGGFTHANRHLVNINLGTKYGTVEGDIECYDFASSYPFSMLAYKYPATKFTEVKGLTVDDILELSDRYAFIIEIEWTNVELRDKEFPMPAMQFSKSIKCLKPVLDNGRILSCEYNHFMVNEVDLSVLAEQYDTTGLKIIKVEKARKERLPKYFTDYIFKCFVEKTMLKGGDPVLYSIAKAKLNSLYGLFVQACIKRMFEENYDTGEYSLNMDASDEELYEKFLNNKNSMLNYAVGCWVTSYSYRNLFELFKCCELPCYGDTDSCYGVNFDKVKIEAYNENCKKLIKKAGYGAVLHNGREYWLGIAEHDEEEDTYTEFKVMGAKRYCGRHKYGEQDLKITVAGVPKEDGAKCLKDDINNFKVGFNFKGEETGKKTHTYIYTDEIYIDNNGNEVGDSIDLTPGDYVLSCCIYDEIDSADTDMGLYDDVLIDYLK